MIFATELFCTLMAHRGEFCATLKKVRFCGILYVTNDSFKCYIKVGEPMGENKTPQELDFERKHEEYLHRIQNLRLIDDPVSSSIFITADFALSKSLNFAFR